MFIYMEKEIKIGDIIHSRTAEFKVLETDINDKNDTWFKCKCTYSCTELWRKNEVIHFKDISLFVKGNHPSK